MTAEDRAGMSFALTCKDIQKSVAFYCESLGFKMKESWPDENAPMWCNLLLEGQSVMLGAAMPPEKVGEMCGNDPEEIGIHTQLAEAFRDHPAGVGVSFYLAVADVDAFDAEI